MGTSDRTNISRQLHNHSFTPTQLVQLYNFPSRVDGHGQCVAIIELGGGYRLQDLTAYFAQLGVAMPRMKTVAVDGAHNHPTGDPSGPDGEVMLDIGVAGALAPAAQFVVYFAPIPTAGSWTRSRLLSMITRTDLQSSRLAGAVLSRVGPHKPCRFMTRHFRKPRLSASPSVALRVTMAPPTESAMGTRTSIFRPPAPTSWPVGDPSRGRTCGDQSGSGVERRDDGRGYRWRYQRVLHHARISEAGQRPAIGQPWGSAGTWRPDVAGDADPTTGYLIRVDHRQVVFGGTSAVAPLWAALIALINQQLRHRK